MPKGERMTVDDEPSVVAKAATKKERKAFGKKVEEL